MMKKSIITAHTFPPSSTTQNFSARWKRELWKLHSALVFWQQLCCYPICITPVVNLVLKQHILYIPSELHPYVPSVLYVWGNRFTSRFHWFSRLLFLNTVHSFRSVQFIFSFFSSNIIIIVTKDKVWSGRRSKHTLTVAPGAFRTDLKRWRTLSLQDPGFVQLCFDANFMS